MVRKKKHACRGDGKGLCEDYLFQSKTSWFDRTEEHRTMLIQLTSLQVF